MRAHSLTLVGLFLAQSLACSSSTTDEGQATPRAGNGSTTAGRHSTGGTVATLTAGGTVGQSRGGSGGATALLGGASNTTAGRGSGGGGGNGGLASGLSSCDVSKITCKIAVPNCSTTTNPNSLVVPTAFGIVPEVDEHGTCYTGRCVPIERCACTTASQCSNTDQYTCWIGAGHCGPYVY